MNNDFDVLTTHPVQTFLYAIGAVILGAFGIGPLRALSKRFTKTSETGSANEASEQQNIRRGDALADSYQILASRAMAEKDTAINDKNVAIEKAQKELHAFRNEAQADIARITLESIEKIRTAETRAVAAEARASIATERADRAEEQVGLLRADIAKLNRRIDALTGYRGTQTEAGI